MGNLKAINIGSKNGQWKGDNVGYSSLHEWVSKRINKPLKCKDCGEIKKLELCNINNQYNRELNNWEWLCRRCHMSKDGRLQNLINRPRTPPILTKEIIDKIRTALRKGKYINCIICNKEFYRKKSHLNDSNNYCSKECYKIILIKRNKKIL